MPRADPWGVRQKRVRRKAARQRLRLRICRRKDPRAYDYGSCALVAADAGAPITHKSFASLAEAEHWLDTR